MKKLLVLFLALLLTTACSPAHSTNPQENNQDVYTLRGSLSQSFDSTRVLHGIPLPETKSGTLTVKFYNASADAISDPLWLVVYHPDGTTEKFDAAPLMRQDVDSLEFEVQTIPGDYTISFDGTGTNTFVEYLLEWKASDTD